ncbi:hypothetical protein Patl1_01810 [Pistacia atlantica]|uniref:Uncharacterized protein n=1 Tax=Pistacia atlantica TaxID=434234 RepID=A0ACC1CDC8_9ROSI|nr:hypothetical protein Patl1_01810 [Pistacia atlantica]
MISELFRQCRFRWNSLPPADNEVEFRSYADDAWYSAQLLLDRDGEKLTVRLLNFPPENEETFSASKFKSLRKLEEFEGRFRPVSVQLQDSECSEVVAGLRVCASHAFNDNDFRFFDAVVENAKEWFDYVWFILLDCPDNGKETGMISPKLGVCHCVVIHRKHSFASGEEECLCRFILCWKHGPNAGTLMEKKVENICIVQSNVELNPHVASFAKRVRERIGGADHKHISASNGDSATCKSSAGCRENSSSIVKQKSTFDQCLMRGKCAKQSISSISLCEGNTSDLQDIDIEIGGDGYHYIIFLENLEKEISPSTVIEFIHQQTRITPQAYIFPSLLSELSTRGAIMLDSKKNLEELSNFLSNPDQIIVSSKGRPWVVNKNFSRHDAFRASIGTFMLNSQKKLKKTNGVVRHELKVVCCGTEEYRRAKELRDLFMEFSLSSRATIQEASF